MSSNLTHILHHPSAARHIPSGDSCRACSNEHTWLGAGRRCTLSRSTPWLRRDSHDVQYGSGSRRRELCEPVHSIQSRYLPQLTAHVCSRQCKIAAPAAQAAPLSTRVCVCSQTLLYTHEPARYRSSRSSRNECICRRNIVALQSSTTDALHTCCTTTIQVCNCRTALIPPTSAVLRMDCKLKVTPCVRIYVLNIRSLCLIAGWRI